MGTVSLTGLKLPQRGADHPPHFSVGLRVGWSCTAAYPVCLQRLDLYIHQRRIYWTIPCFLCLRVGGCVRGCARALHVTDSHVTAWAYFATPLLSLALDAGEWSA